MKSHLNAFQMISYKLLHHAVAFHLPISLPSVLLVFLSPPVT